ncbi:MAG: hypothetical protein DWQ04_14315 [Chloroflexi bacterium]|nr:MAG: hypothetical protein DWQ04_14315 [Chloroflexota bacterium]
MVIVHNKSRKSKKQNHSENFDPLILSDPKKESRNNNPQISQIYTDLKHKQSVKSAKSVVKNSENFFHFTL